MIAHEPPITNASAGTTQQTYVQRLQMLLSVDDIVVEVTDLLRATSVLHNTYLLFCADHGWNLGEFGVMSGKHQVYEHTLRVPFVISGPGIAAGRKLPDVIAMVDIGPTILELAGAAVPSGEAFAMDGRSFAPALLDPAAAPPTRSTTMLVEFYSLSDGSPDTPPCAVDDQEAYPWPGNLPAAAVAPAAAVVDDPEGSVAMGGSCYNLGISHSDWSNNTFIALRIINATHDLTYSEYTQVSDMYDFEHVYFHELYDVQADPFQMRNIYSEQSQSTQEALHEALFKEFRCKGATCNSWVV